MTYRTFIYRACTHHFNHLVSVTAGGPVSLRAHVAKFYGRLQLIGSVLRASKFSVLKYIEIVILSVYFIVSLLTSASFWYFCDISFQLFKLLCLTNNHWWWFCTQNAHMVLLLMKSDSKWCIHLDIFFNYNHFTHLVSGSAGGPESTCSQALRSTSVDSKRFESIDIFRVEIHWNCNFWGLLTIPLGFILFSTFVISLFNFLATLFG